MKPGIWVIAVAIAGLLMIGCAAAAQFTFQDVQIDSIGGTGTSELRMDVTPPVGFTGYYIYLEVLDPSIAHVTAVTYNPALAGMTNTVPLPPFTSGIIGWVDVNEVLEAPGGETDVLLATLTFTSLAPGSTALNATMAMVTDDPGEDMIPDSTLNWPSLDVYAVPEAAFSADTTTPGVGDTVTFTDESTGNVVSRAWDFGDGGTSEDQGPVHAYSAPGTYTVSLTVTNPAGTNTETRAGYISVVDTGSTPVADFTATATNGLAPMTVSFTDTSTNSPTSWLWEYRIADSGAWTQFSTGRDPADVVFSDAGTYDVRLTATNGAGSDTMVRTHVFAAANAAEPLALVRSGSVSGGLYVESSHTYATGVTEVTHTFTLPSFTDIEWARLYVNTYSGTAAGDYGLTSTVQFNGNTLGVETMDIKSTTTGASFPLNDHVTKVYSDYEAQYDVTSLITSTSPSVHVRGEAISGLTFDGRIKGITLVVAYNDGDGDNVEYWVNHGQHWIPATTGYGSTTFDASGIASGWASAASSIRFHSSSDATYEFNTVTKASGTSPDTGGMLNTWDVTDDLVIGANTLEFTKGTSGSYKATLATLTARYLAPPTADFVADKTTASTTDIIQFTDQSTGAIAWAWDFDNDGTIDSTDQHPTWTYATEGLKTVSLTVTNAGGSDTGIKTDYIAIVNTEWSQISFLPETQSFNIGETAEYLIVLDRAPEGLAGYDMVVSFGNTGIAEFTSVTYPGWAELIHTPPVPSQSVLVQAADTGKQVQEGAADVVLATITVRGISSGTTPIVISNLYIHADGGSPIQATTGSGQAQVGSLQPPVADFSATPTSGTAPLDVTFTDQSAGDITSWAWDFDNNGVIDSTLQHPSYTYTTAGTYTVALTVTGPGGSDTETRTGCVTVMDAAVAPVADFSATPTSGTAPLDVTFTDQSTNSPASWKWEYRAGSGSWMQFSTLQDPSFSFTTSGTYDIRLTVGNSAGSDERIRTGYIVVNPLPVSSLDADFIANPLAGRSPLIVRFTDMSTGDITAWAWDFDNDGRIDSNQQNPVYLYRQAGSYTVRLVVSGPEGTDEEVKEQYIAANEKWSRAPVAFFAVDRYYGGDPLTVRFTDRSRYNPDSFLWTFGDGTTSTEMNPQHTYTEPGWYRPSLVVSNEWGSSHSYSIILVLEQPWGRLDIQDFPVPSISSPFT
ncbi:MAG: PKD domain-containing protein [Methanoregulaceae archaeon]|jgi:PKD repeat protein